MTAPARPDLLHALPVLAAAKIHEIMPELRTCKGFQGRLTVDRLKAHGIAAPAVLVVRLGARQSTTFAGPARAWTVRMAAFVVARDELGAQGRRDEQAGRIAQALLGLLPENDWGASEFVGGAEEITEEPLVTDEAEKAAMAIHVVSWSHQVSLGWVSTDEPLTPVVYLGMAPDVGPDHLDDYTVIGGDA